MRSDRKIIIDCDPGTDDALALALAAFCMKQDVARLLSSYGNAPLTDTDRNLRGLAEAFGFSCPVLRGSAYPAGKSEFSGTDYHGENGLCGIVLPVSRENPEQTRADWAEEVYSILRENRGAIYVALGPLTNLATLLSVHPDVCDWIERAVIMGGGLAFGNTPCGAEYNFSLDPVSDRIVLQSALKKTLVTLDLTHTLAFSEAETLEIIGDGWTDAPETSPYRVAAALFLGNLRSSLAHGNAGAIIHDAATVAWLYDSRACDMETCSLVCDDVGRLRKTREGFSVERIARMDKNYMKELLGETFRWLKENDCQFGRMGK